MTLIRRFEESCAEQYALGKIRGFLHLYIGEEAIAVGSISNLEPQDYVITHYRDHGHALARGLDPKVVMAELFGKATGCSRGRGGSMHLFDASLGFMGGHAIVGGQLPIALGLALASKYRGTNEVTLCFFGDGAVNQGEFHESMNLAALWKLPVVFLLENNLYGMGTHIERSFAGGRHVYRVAEHYSMPSKQIDGMDVLEVRSATREVFDWVRQGNGPHFLEALTYRFRGHSMADPEEYRRQTEEERWLQRDPITVFCDLLLQAGEMDKAQISHLEAKVEAQIKEAVQFADESPFPEAATLEEDVYASL